ncbi:hypothetical protein ANCCEY_01606 [Ancylostoma ceylanicum]|uniref:Uncharacterized protein n=1 Tax=Ancylostoma ceylanicum TaxID=53326 RepID=A0A0D6M763_9BILA|nr:hypothetical protein ANCCEY_01606 [Ancylostoma ceylanicum]
MTGFGTSRRETTKMVDSNHPEYDHEASIDQTTIPSQMGSNKHIRSSHGIDGVEWAWLSMLADWWIGDVERTQHANKKKIRW